MRLTTALALVLVGSSVGLGIGIGAHLLMPESPLVKGIKVAHHTLPEGETPGAWLRGLGREIRERSLEFRLKNETGDRTWGYTFGQIGVDIDIGKTMAAAGRVGHEGSLLTRIHEAQAAKRGEIDIPYSYRVRKDGARDLLEDIAPALVIDPVDAKLDIQGRRKIPDVVGRELDIDATLENLESANFETDHLTIDLVTKPRYAKVTLDTLVAVDLTKVASSFETTFHLFGTGAGRAVNIKNAAGFIDGTVLMPGDVFSFNEKVGPRTLERGFTWAPEIQNDELTTGVGGGTCQVSTTLFGAALFGALEVVERRNHSRPSSYTKLGLDATVIYNLQDLKIKNTLPFAVMIHAYLPEPEKIRVELLGGDPVADVTYTFGIGSSSDFLRRITYKPFLQPGTRILHQRGARGYDVQSLVSVKYKGGRTEDRQYFSQYRPTPEVYWIGPGFDEKDLPPLPEHARGIEGRANEYDTYPVF